MQIRCGNWWWFTWFEAAKLRDLNLETHVVEFAPRLMAVQIDDLGGKFYAVKLKI
jgi:nitrite reductase (NADH) large subunit